MPAVRSKPAAAPALKRPAAAARSRTPAARKATEPSEVCKAMPCLLLGLERRPDRRKRCEEMLKKELPWLNFEFFPASDGKLHTIPDEEIAKSWNTKNNALYGDYEAIYQDGVLVKSEEEFRNPGVVYDFSPGERGCAHSHYRMWKRAAEMDGPLLIIEDDMQIVFKRSKGGKSNGKVFTKQLNLGMEEAAKKNAEVLYLGWAGRRDGNYLYHKAPGGKKNDYIRKVEYVWTTVAYVIWPEGAKKLLAAASPMNQPVDNFMAWECREGRLNSYVLLDEGDAEKQYEGGIAGQCDFLGDSDIQKSDGGDQNDDAAQFLTVQAGVNSQTPTNGQNPAPTEAVATKAADAPTAAAAETAPMAVTPAEIAPVPVTPPEAVKGDSAMA